MSAFDPFHLDRFPAQNSVHLVSPPQSFDGGEEAYDETVGGANRENLLASGRGALRLARHYSRRPIQSLVEIGAGGGTCSVGLIADAPDCDCLITDTSPKFLQMIAQKLARHDISRRRVRFATLSGEDLLSSLRNRRISSLSLRHCITSAIGESSWWIRSQSYGLGVSWFCKNRVVKAIY